MEKLKTVLLASHGTEGARAAERTALRLCPRRATLHHLIVVPDFWKGMMGDDWLNNASTRDVFGRYVESQLEDDVRKHARRLQREAERRGIRYRVDVVTGKPAECLKDKARAVRADLIVVGAPRAKGRAGLRSRMVTDDVIRSLDSALLVVPYPHGRRRV